MLKSYVLACRNFHKRTISKVVLKLVIIFQITGDYPENLLANLLVHKKILEVNPC